MVTWLVTVVLPAQGFWLLKEIGCGGSVGDGMWKCGDEKEESEILCSECSGVLCCEICDR